MNYIIAFSVLLGADYTLALRKDREILEEYVIQFGSTSTTSAYAVTFVMLAFFLGALFKALLKHLDLRISENVFIFPLGIILGLLPLHVKEIWDYTTIIDSSPRQFLYFIIPVQMFKMVMDIDVHTFFKCWVQIIIISLPCTDAWGNGRVAKHAATHRPRTAGYASLPITTTPSPRRATAQPMPPPPQPRVSPPPPPRKSMPLLGTQTGGYAMQVLIAGYLIMLTIEADWFWTDSVAFGIVLSPIFAQSIIRVLEASGSNTKHKATLLRAESACSIALSYILLELIIFAPRMGVGDYLWSFIYCIIIGVFLGFVIGKTFVYILNFSDNQVTTHMLTSVCLPLMIFYLLATSLSTMSLTCIFMVGFVISGDRSIFRSDIDSYTIQFLIMVTDIMDNVVFFIAGVYLMYYVLPRMILSDYVSVLLIYGVLQFARLITFLLFAFFLNKFGYGITFKTFVILVVGGGIRSTTSIWLMLLAYTEFSNFFKKSALIFYVFGAVFLSCLINIPVTRLLINSLTISEKKISHINLSNCIHYIMSLRDHKIQLLKLNRLLSDANWHFIKKEAVLKHPFECLDNNGGYDDDDNFGISNIVCPDCSKEVPEEPTIKAYAEMMEEARTKILKIKKISYSRQYERGMLHKKIASGLLTAVENAADRSDKAIDLHEIKKLFRDKGYKAWLQNLSMSIFIATKLACPQTYWRRKSYHLAKNRIYMIAMGVVRALNVAVDISLCVYVMLRKRRLEKYFWIFAFLETTFFVLYLWEFIIKVLANAWIKFFHHGIKGYFRDTLYRIEFFELLNSFVLMLLTLLQCSMPQSFFENHYEVYIITTIIGFLRLLSLLRICNTEKVMLYFKDILDARLKYAYAFGKAFVTGEDDVLEILDYIIVNNNVKAEMRKKLESDKMDIFDELTAVQRKRPWVATTVKTKQAMMSIISCIEDTVLELKSLGWSGELEYQHLQESLGNLKRNVKRIRLVTPSSPRSIFKEIPWIGNEENIAHYLYDNVLLVHFEPGDIICKEGNNIQGIYVVVTGIVKMIYNPTPDVIEKLKKEGTLPIMDHITSLSFDRNVEQYIISGNSIGELSILTKRPYNCTIKADTYTEMYFVPSDILEKAFKISNDPLNGLESRIWKHVVSQLCVSILMRVSMYKSLTLNKINGLIEKAFVPNFKYCKTFTVSETVEGAIVVEGVVANDVTGCEYVAPCYIPRTVKRLYFMDRDDNFDEVKLLIIPTKNVQDYGVYMAENDSSLIDTQSGSCRLHRDARDCASIHSIFSGKGMVNRRVTLLYAVTPSSELTPLIEGHITDDSDTDLRVIKVDHKYRRSEAELIQRRLSLSHKSSTVLDGYEDKFTFKEIKTESSSPMAGLEDGKSLHSDHKSGERSSSIIKTVFSSNLPATRSSCTLFLKKSEP